MAHACVQLPRCHTAQRSQVARSLVDAMTAGSSSADPNYMACVALATDSPEIVKMFQREFGDALVHVDGPIVHIDRRSVGALRSLFSVVVASES